MLPRQSLERQLTDRRGVSFAFDSGCVSLDFGYTGGEGRYAVFEVLHEPADLTGWLSRSGLALPALPVDAPLLEQAKGLRAAIWAVFSATTTGTTPGARAVESLNDRARQEPLVPQLGAAGPAWFEPTLPQTLSALARETIEVVTAHRDRVRQCAADDCPLMFYDTSRGGQRRWCSMQRCGNRHKVRAHRAR